MTHVQRNRVAGILLFLLVQAVYLLTMAPTLSFWDCGEFIATARTLGVPHPPGAPLFLLMGRVFSLFPFFSDIGARVNLLSTLMSSAAVVLTYLITVRLIIICRKDDPDTWSQARQVAHYGGAAVGALALAFSDSFWFNAVETEVYAASTFFTTLVFWLVLRWYQDSSGPGNERWLMAAMYMIGLSIGVHLLSLLVLFAVIMVYWYRRHAVTPFSLLGMAVVATAAFILVYGGVIQGVPFLLRKFSWWGGGALLVVMMAGVWYAHLQRQRVLHTAAMSLLLLVIGYTSYTTIFVRAQAGPPINENDPSTADAFLSYLNREQYGDLPLWPRRWSSEPLHQYYYGKYDSEAEYFFRYQLGQMYVRYFGWQFIGRAHQGSGAPVDLSQLWGLPFLVGILGVVTHVRQDWKTGSVVTALFVLTGAALVIYLNQVEPQPRERDYSYVGSFFAFALWIGFGASAIIEKITGLATCSSMKTRLAVVALLPVMLLVPARMLYANYYTHDRSGNYVAWDWAWNILQSCGRDAILFTNGDNDTFPLWYLQEVEGIRQDVRVVNLSLANTPWYLEQLKHSSPRGAKPVSFSLSDQELQEIGYVPMVPVQAELEAGEEQRRLRERYRSIGALPSAEIADTIRWELQPAISFRGQGFLRPQDIAVFDIIMSNFRHRPICFAITVGSDNLIGLKRWLTLEGLAYRLQPMQAPEGETLLDVTRLCNALCGSFRYTNLASEEVFIDETSKRLSGNYKPLFTRLALELAREPERLYTVMAEDGGLVEGSGRQLALHALDRSEDVLPLSLYGMEPELVASVVYLYARFDEKEKAYPYIAYLEKLAEHTTPERSPELYYALALSFSQVGLEEKVEMLRRQLQESSNE
ncbi:glycosyltransferase family 117 protein [Prosthecochloris sp. CIB 2401]|uniref:glycosyltransferase family 117 protein n=1 Tax=Prosthecochloris sp. CIB 2401 TaxID=1868325 RepID=UPI00080AC228|nr:DUF2723 domain-containing protein [Prosthecochloris sp. CIB 2401]ANT65803.1 hypothetical protein Ptc2401_02073 [Prosthecochloris sp. CIB 2401]